MLNYCGCNPENECRETRVIKDLLTHPTGSAATVQFHDPEKVSSDLYSQDKQTTEHIIQSKLPFERSRNGDQIPIYSDVGYILLGIIIEHITHMPIDSYVKQNIYDPLGLTHILFYPLKNTNYCFRDFTAAELNGNRRGDTISFPNVCREVVQGEV